MKPVIVFVIALVVGGAAFYGGIQYQKTQSSTGKSLMLGQQGTGRAGTGMRRIGSGQPISGEIVNKDESSLTVKLGDGSSRIVLFTNKTIFNKTESVEKTELQNGMKVGIFGTSNTDGSVTAQNIQLNPQFRMNGNTSGSNK